MNERRCVTAVVVTYNSAETIGRCIASLFGTAADWLVQVVVVDNASTDNTREIVRTLPLDIKMIENERNYGFGAACNCGAREVDSEYVLFFNPDASAEVGCLAELVIFLDARKAAACCGPFIHDEHDHPDSAARRGFPTPSNAIGRLFYLERVFPWSRRFARYSMPWLGYDREAHVDCILGACMLLRRDVFASLNGFDEEFFLFGEDIDLCKRLAHSGHETWYIPSARIIHSGGHSMKSASGIARREFYRAMRVYMGKHWRILPVWQYRMIDFGIALRALLDRVIGH